MNRNATAYSLLFAIHSHLGAKHHVPTHISDSYRHTINHILPFYANSPRLSDQLQKSIPVRNRVCHFKPVTRQDIVLLTSICSSLHISQSTKVGMRR
ncbi:hypothetical protein ACE106_15455 [Shouchella clausii]|uniref:hypothetical protein n=1 Tax=Shouchella clausii TaxID=79880 RepID=UPI00289F6D46|nr:hypothetical protein [Shouchella clausii]